MSGRQAPSLAEVSAAFPQLEILALIGQGGMGFVYQVRQPALDRTVALKILSPELGRDPAFAERFAREARVLGKLNHPNIVTVFESGESGGFFYLLMEFVDGVNLRQAMRAGRFTPQQALGVVPGICDALQAAHAQGVWHRDIKPENILLDAQGRVKIVDFGIARLVGDPERNFTLTRTGGQLGSAAYMAPEQHEKPHDVDHRADIYSLGVVIYEMLTGELPLGRFPAPSRRASVSARIDDIVLRTLEKERELRQQSAAEVKTDVQGAATAAEPARKNAASDRASGLTRLPRLVRWSLGLFLGGGALMGSAALVADSFKTQQTTAMMALLIALGGAASAAGLLGTLWALYEMKRGKPDEQGVATSAELAREKAAPENTSPLTRLPRLVLWSLGLLVGGVALWVATSAMGSSLAQMIDERQFYASQILSGDFPNGLKSMTVAVLVLRSIAGLACTLGLLGSLWSLYEMKRGWMPAVGRWLLIALTIAPLACGGLGLALAYMFKTTELQNQKGELQIMMGGTFGALGIVFGILFLLARPLQPATPRRRRLGNIYIALAAIATVSCAVLTKRFDYHWPHVFYGERATLKLLSPNRPPDDQLLALLKQAAGPFAGHYKLTVSDGAAIVFAVTREKSLLDRPDRLSTHSNNCLFRLFDLLPANAITPREFGLFDPSGFGRPEWRRQTDPRYLPQHATIAVLAVLGALLAAIAGGRRAVFVVAGGVALHGMMFLLPVWPVNETAPRVIDAAPLPPHIAPDELPAPDFSTPENAVMSVFDARYFGRLDVVKRGVSREFAAIIEAHPDGWEGFMTSFDGEQDARRFAVLSSKRDKQDDGIAMVSGTFVSRDRGAFGDARSVVVFENGEWNLDSLDSRYRPTARARHEAVPAGAASGAKLPATSVEEIFRKMNAAANESNGDVFSRHIPQLAPSPKGGNPNPLPGYMQLFFGQVRFFKILGAEPRESDRVPVSLPAGLENSDRPVQATWILAGIEKPDGKVRYHEFRYSVVNGQWYCFGNRSPEYRALCRIEFHPENGDAESILRTHLDPKSALLPVRGADGQFDIEVIRSDAEEAASNANENADHLRKSLGTFGLDRSFKILEPAKKPEKSWKAEEATQPAAPESPKLEAPLDKSQKPRPAVKVNILAEDRIELDGTPISLDDLAKRIKAFSASDEGAQLSVNIEKDISVAYIVRVNETMRNSGAKIEPGTMEKVLKASSYTISGQVNNPARRFVADEPITVSMAITLAGGPTPLAALEKVQLLRTNAAGATKTIILDVRKALAGKVAPEEDPVVLAGDKINVPESRH